MSTILSSMTKMREGWIQHKYYNSNIVCRYKFRKIHPYVLCIITFMITEGRKLTLKSFSEKYLCFVDFSVCVLSHVILIHIVINYIQYIQYILIWYNYKWNRYFNLMRFWNIFNWTSFLNFFPYNCFLTFFHFHFFH